MVTLATYKKWDELKELGASISSLIANRTIFAGANQSGVFRIRVPDNAFTCGTSFRTLVANGEVYEAQPAYIEVYNSKEDFRARLITTGSKIPTRFGKLEGWSGSYNNKQGTKVNLTLFTPENPTTESHLYQVPANPAQTIDLTAKATAEGYEYIITKVNKEV